MLKIFKYEIEPKDYIEFRLPEKAQILTVQTQNDRGCLWALVNPDNKIITRYFCLIGTGHPIKEDIFSLSYCGTFQLIEGNLVFHLFEILK